MRVLDMALVGVAIVATLALISLGTIWENNFERRLILGETTHTLKNYNGVGSTVYKHGTIVKVVDNKPVVVGHFTDESGKEYPGTVQIEEVK